MDLRTFEGIEYESFYEAAVERGLMADDRIWISTAQDAMDSMRKIGERIYWMCIFIATNLPDEPMVLIDTFWEKLVPMRYLTNRAMGLRYLLLRFEFILR